MKNRRRLVNYLIDPATQLTFAGYMVLIGTAFAVATALYSFLFLSRLNRYFSSEAEVPEFATSFLSEQLSSYVSWLVVILVAFLALLYGYALLYAHRITGASYAVSKFIRTKLLTGEYSSRLSLRRHDHLRQIANDLNELAARLDQDGSEPSILETPAIH